MKMFSHSIYFVKKCFHFVLLIRFGNRYNAAINCITLQHEKFIPLNFYELYYANNNNNNNNNNAFLC
jgi:hypothetical protein